MSMAALMSCRICAHVKQRGGLCNNMYDDNPRNLKCYLEGCDFLEKPQRREEKRRG